MCDNEPPPTLKESNLERMINKQLFLKKTTKQLEPRVIKYSEPILTPSMFNYKFTSIRNPGAFKYQDRFGMLLTVRHAKDNISRLHLAWSKDGTNFSLDEKPFINTDEDSKLGVEDARITQVENTYFITYTAFKEHKENVNTTRIKLAKTKDFKTIEKLGVILDDYGNNKNCVIWWDKKAKIFWVIHRPFDGGCLSARIATTKDFKNFKDYGIILKPRQGMWDDARVGMNTPLIETEKGLFGIYHGADKQKNIYRLGYVLLDKNNPTKVIERSKKPLLEPKLWWETVGGKKGAEVPNVVFGCGLVPIQKNHFRLFYSGTDRYTGYADILIN